MFRRIFSSAVVCPIALALIPTFAQAQTFTLTPVASGLADIVQIRHAFDARKFVVLQGGQIRVLNASNVVNPTAFFEMAQVTTCAFPDGTSATMGFTSGGERGLLGLAFHPDYVSNGQLYVSFTDGRGDTTVTRFLRDGTNPDRVNHASCQIVLRIDQDFSNHNGGDISFGPDGLLYIPMGDGGDANDPCNRGQTLDPADLLNTAGTCTVDTNFTGIGGGDGNSRALLGKMVRIDVDGTTTKANATGFCGAMILPAAPGTTVVANYRLPQGPDLPNPTTIDGENPCDEVWAYGLRNPFRFSFDRNTGDMFIGDVGQGTTEEVSFQPASSDGGENYGWDLCEGPYNRGSNTGTCTNLTTPHTPPILFYESAGRCSVIGGYRYRGSSPSAFGKYFYGDYCTGEIFIGTENAGNWTAVVAPIEVNNFGLYGFGEDLAGELYVADANVDQLLRFDFPDAGTIFGNGFE